MKAGPLVQIEDLHVAYLQRGWRRGPVRAVDGVSFCVSAGETVGLVGESGSGKSTIGRALLGLTRPTSGQIVVAGRTHTVRGSANANADVTQAVFQDPYSSLNPSRTIGRTLTEPLEVRHRLRRQDADDAIRRLLESVSLPADSAERYPYSFSGGQRQRIAIARSLAIGPKLVVCDEALSALDLVTQAHILNLLRRLQRETGIAFLFIAHNLPVVAQLSHRIVVLYRGRVMEQGPANEVHENPLHPYTKALLAAVPVPDPQAQLKRRALRAQAAAVDTANAAQPPEHGCPFAPRCASAADVCWRARPGDVQAGGRVLACHLFDPRSGHPAARAATVTYS